MSEIKGKKEEIQHALAVYEAEVEFLEEFDSDEIINFLTYRDFLQNAIVEHPYLMKPYIKKLHLLDQKLMKSADYIRGLLSPYWDGRFHEKSHWWYLVSEQMTEESESTSPLEVEDN